MTQRRPERLKVALVAPSLRILGGQAVQADRLIRAWRDDAAIDAWLVPVNPVPPGILQPLTAVKYARTVVTEAVYLPLLFRELAKADVVHVFSASYTSFLLAPLPAIAVARTLGKPVVLNYRSGEAPDHLRRSAIARRVIAGVDRNVVPSSFLADVFHSFGIASDVIPNLVDVDNFQYRERRRLRPHLVSTRNFEALYNVACTLRAFQIVQARWPDATLTLVGGGSEEASLRTLVRDLGLRHVTFTGRVSPDEIAAHYANADIYVQSPNLDNMPTSILEAFSSGLPVVSTRAGGIPAIVADGDQGLLVGLNDHRALAASVLRLLDDHGLALSMARAARATCNGRTWPAVRERWLGIYRTVAVHAREAQLATEGL